MAPLPNIRLRIPLDTRQRVHALVGRGGHLSGAAVLRAALDAGLAVLEGRHAVAAGTTETEGESR
jgi:hypothetical protein